MILFDDLPYDLDVAELVDLVVAEGFDRGDVNDVLALSVVDGCLISLDPSIDLSPFPLEQLRALLRLHDTVRVCMARMNVNACVEYAFRDEETGNRLRQADHHIEWQNLWDGHKYSGILAPVGHGKTAQLVARICYRLGDNPQRRIAMICDTSTQAQDRLKVVAQNIEENADLQKVFPHLKKSQRRGDSWCDEEITVERDTIAKEPSLKAFGSGGAINGIRPDEIYLDDVCDFDNTATPHQRLKLVKWYDTTVSTRLPMSGTGRIVFIGTPWHVEDLLHVLKERAVFATQTWSAVINPDDPQELWEPLWIEVVTREALIIRYNGMTPHAFNRKFLCRVRDDGLARFQEAWIKAALWAGRKRTLLHEAPRRDAFGPRLPCFTGVDLGVGQDEHHDLTTLVTIALMPDGRRLLVDLQAGRWTGPEIVQRIVQVHQRYQSTVAVESVAAQDFIRQFSHDANVPVLPFNTTRTKKLDEQWGIESLAVEMRAGRWVLPSGDAGEAEDPEVKALTSEMRNYLPTDHTGDRLMGLWFARELARNYDAAEELAGTDPTYR